MVAILELLKYHARVLYIDIDIHHGDGVQVRNDGGTNVEDTKVFNFFILYAEHLYNWSLPSLLASVTPNLY